MRKLFSATLLACSLTATASAEEPALYLGATLGGAIYEADDLPDWEQKYLLLGGRLGAEFNEHFAAEIRIGRSLNEHNDRVLGVDTTTEVEHYYGAYLKVSAGEKFRPYLMAGYTRTKLSFSASSGGLSAGFADTEGDASFGLGIDVRSVENYAFSAECLQYYNKDGETIDGCNLGFARYF